MLSPSFLSLVRCFQNANLFIILAFKILKWAKKRWKKNRHILLWMSWIIAALDERDDGKTTIILAFFSFHFHPIIHIYYVFNMYSYNKYSIFQNVCVCVFHLLKINFRFDSFCCHQICGTKRFYEMLSSTEITATDTHMKEKVPYDYAQFK